MPKVKIFTSNVNYEDDYHSRSKLGEGVTDWEEMND